MGSPSLRKWIKWIKYASIGTVVFAILVIDRLQDGREIDLESGRTRWFVKFPGFAIKTGPIEETAFSNFLKTRTQLAFAPPRWRSTRISGERGIFSHTFHCTGFEGIESRLGSFIARISEAPIEEACRKKLALELLERLRSGNPEVVSEFYARTLIALSQPETSKEPCERPDVFAPR